jgi:DNA polymerase-3 subunit delta'
LETGETGGQFMAQSGGTGFGGIVGQERAIATLRGTLREGRIPNAYLFEGPWGVGKTRTALALAAALVCRTGGDDACGTCEACRRVARFQHPDVRFLFPVMSDEDDPESIAEVLAEVANDPHHVFTYEKAASIRIGLTRDLLKELAYKPYEGRRRVIVLRDADRMREDQYSAMLKTLEEPGASTLWVLTTARPQRLPPTIRSRCLKVRFRPLREEEIEGYLRERAGVSAAPARLLAALAAGSLARALVLRGENVAGLRDDALRQLGAANTGDPSRVLAAAGEAASWSNREKMRRTLEFQFLLLRDLLRLKHGADEDTLVNRDRVADLRKVAPGVDVREIRRRTALLEEVVRAIDSNVTPEAAFFSAYARWGKTLPQDAVTRAATWPSWS